jgi:hypothetical protein
MPEGRPYSSREDQESREMQAAAERLRDLRELPPPLRAALAHTLYAAATELANGRRLPIEVRRAARHVVQAIREVAPDER